MKHVLVIGGTGMLRGVSEGLNHQGYHLSVIARRKERLVELEGLLEHPKLFTPLALDYSDNDGLRAELKRVQREHGPIQKVVSWISSPAPQALRTIIEEVDQANDGSWDLYHVLGSRSELDKVKAAVAAPETCNYRQVKLGFVIEGGHSRWLTHQEISAGVLRGVMNREPVTIVGTLEPWEMRP